MKSQKQPPILPSKSCECKLSNPPLSLSFLIWKMGLEWDQLCRGCSRDS